MTSINTYTSHLFQHIKEYIETGRITAVDTMKNEVESVIARLQHGQTLEEPGPVNDLVEKLLLEITSFREKAAEYESLLTEVKSYAETLRQERNQVIACAMELYKMAQEQLKENATAIAASEAMKKNTTDAPLHCLALACSPIDPTVRPAPSRTAVISFPGGPRTVTIHPPGSPNYRPIVRDEKGDVIIDFKDTKPLRREGAFRGSLADIDWHKITRVYGRGPEPEGSRSAPPIPCWPDQSWPSLPPPSPSRGASDIIARQRQLSFSMQTDRFGRLLARDYLIKAESPCLPTDVTSSSVSASQDASGSDSEPEAVSTPTSTPPSPSVARGKKRARHVDEDEKVPSTPKTPGSGAAEAPLAQTVKEPRTPTPLPKSSEHHSPDSEGPSKRKKRRSEEVTLVGGTLSGSNSARDLAQPN